MSCSTSQQSSTSTCVVRAGTFLGHKLHGLVQDRCGTEVEHAGKILREQLHVHGSDADVGMEEVVLAGTASCYIA
mgnify:CR=1 FL=1